MIGLGCMRLSTREPRDDAAAIAVIHAALDAGVRLLDTADVYAPDETAVGHNERLVAAALRTWSGDRSGIVVATKGGLRRQGGQWVPDGRARHLRAAAETSRERLGVDAIDVYQLHAVDPRTPIETSVRALAALQRDGVISRIGLCNVTVAQIEAARAIAQIDSVQVELGPLSATSFRNGVAEYCRDHGLRLIAYRPLGGDRIAQLDRDDVLVRVAERHGATLREVALAWLFDLGACVVPIAGATRVESARSLGRAAAIVLSDDDRAALDERFPAGRLLRVPRAQRRPPRGADGDVVLVMGSPAAGKSTIAAELVAQGHERLNRDERGGRLSDLVDTLDDGLRAGRRRWVLDNTYPTRDARNEVIECAWRHGVPARCVWVTTSTADAQLNAVSRMIEGHGRLPMPEEIRARGDDHRFFGPDALFRYERSLERPTPDEGFEAVDERSFVRRADTRTGRAVLFEVDGVLCPGEAHAEPIDGRRDAVQHLFSEGWTLLGMAWRPRVSRGEIAAADVEAALDHLRGRLGAPIDIAYCPHDAGPPVCWCRKPLPGLALDLFARHGTAAGRSVLVGPGAADRTLAERLGMKYREPAEFFDGSAS